MYLANIQSPIRDLFQEEISASLQVAGVDALQIYDGTASVAGYTIGACLAAARATAAEGKVHALVLGAANASAEVAAVELTKILRCPLFVLLGDNDEATRERLDRLSFAWVYLADQRARLVADLAFLLKHTAATPAPRHRIFLCHLDPAVREMLVLFFAEMPTPLPITFAHDEATSILDDSAENFIDITTKVASRGPVDLVILGANNTVADFAVPVLRELFDCPIFVLTSVLDYHAELRLIKAGVNRIFHSPHVQPLFDEVAAYLASLHEAGGKTSAS